MYSDVLTKPSQKDCIVALLLVLPRCASDRKDSPDSRIPHDLIKYRKIGD